MSHAITPPCPHYIVHGDPPRAVIKALDLGRTGAHGGRGSYTTSYSTYIRDVDAFPAGAECQSLSLHTPVGPAC